MKSVLTVEFTARNVDQEIVEESISLHSPEEFIKFVSPGGGCEKIPDDVAEIRMVFLAPKHKNKQNPVADKPVTLQIGKVIFNGPFSEIIQTAMQIVDKAGRGELAREFIQVTGLQ